MVAIANGSSPKKPPVLLHHNLDLWILEACNLSNIDMIFAHLYCFFTACHPPSPSSYTRPRQPPHHHDHHPKIVTSNPYVTISIAGATVASTCIIPNFQDPKWSEHFKIPLAHHSPFIGCHVKDNVIFNAELIGTISIPATLIASGDLIRDWYPILSPSKNPPKPETALLVSLQYRPIVENPIYIHGIVGDPKKLGMRDTNFSI